MGVIIALVAPDLCAGSDAESLIENAGYSLLKEGMVSKGDSEIHANCFLTVMKSIGATSDVTDIRNYFNPHKMANNLSAKADFANFVCSPAGTIVMVLLFCFIFAVCCVCLKRCCTCRTQKPIIFQMASPQLLSNNVKVPYVRMNVA